MIKNALYIENINQIFDDLIENTNLELDLSLMNDTLGIDKIKRISAERITIKRIKQILINELEGVGQHG